MPWNIQEVEVGLAIGGIAGLALGYEARKLHVRFRTWRAERKRPDCITKRDVKVAYKHDKVVAIVERSEKPPMIPIKRSRRSTPNERAHEQPIQVINPDRDDVIAALMNSGYKKDAAIKATDACSLVERAHGLQQWTIAAFKNAHGAK